MAPITTEPDPLDRLSSVHRVTLSHQFPVIVSTVVPNLFIFVLEKKFNHLLMTVEYFGTSVPKVSRTNVS